jgi:DNA polymerase III delta' subunit
MDGARTRGQSVALQAVATMVRGPGPQAVLFIGPDGVGKTTLALDLAAGLFCTAAPADRPCRDCRACRLVEHGSHPDLHRLGPVGPGRQVVIGGPEAKYRGVRDLISELALMPVEGGARVAIIESADRMNEDAQTALLKTLEEPPSGATIVICADQLARLLPTVRSRCAVIRLGLLGPRDIEGILDDHGLADPPTAARLARLAGGRPGIALAYARAPDAVLIRAELTRLLLDFTDAGAAARLAAARAAIPRAIMLAAALAADDPAATRSSPRGRRRGGATAPTPIGAELEAGMEAGADVDADDLASTSVRTPATDRRRGVEVLLGLWSDVARDLILVGAGGSGSIHDTVLIDELGATASGVDAADVVRFLGRIGRSAEALAANVSPELILDALVLAWPGRRAAA